MCNIVSHCVLRKSPDLCTASLLYLMMSKTISPGCGVRASPMTLLSVCGSDLWDHYSNVVNTLLII